MDSLDSVFLLMVSVESTSQVLQADHSLIARPYCVAFYFY